MHRLALRVFLILVSTLLVSAWAASSPGPVSSCMVIDTPGTYHLDSDITGAPNTVLGNACIVINSSNVNFDCAGHKITNNGTVPSDGVAIAGGPISDVSDVLVKNCIVDNYTNGFTIYEVSNSVFLNNSVFSNNASVNSPFGPYLKMGFFSSTSNSNRYENNSVYNGAKGFDIQYSNDNVFSNNNVVNSSLGLENSIGNNFIENNIIDIGGVIFLRRSNSNNFEKNDITNSTIHLLISENNTFDGNVIHDGNIGFSTGVDSHFNVFRNNRVFNQVSNGIFLDSDNNQLISNEIFNITDKNDSAALQIRSSNNTITGNIIHDFKNIGVALYGSSFNTITDNKFYNGHIGFLVMESGSTNLFSGNTANNVEMDLICQNGKCEERGVQKPPQAGGCTSDGNCTSEQYCNAGSCIPVATEACGYIVEHTWESYECCADADCASGQSCQDNKCTVITIPSYDLTGPGTGSVGDSITFTAYINSQPMENAQLKVIKPDGSFDFLSTDSSGKNSIDLTQEGTYDVYLLVDYKVAKTLTLVSSPKETPAEIPVTMEVVAFLVTLIVVVAFLIYYFSKGKIKIRKGRR